MKIKEFYIFVNKKIDGDKTKVTATSYNEAVEKSIEYLSKKDIYLSTDKFLDKYKLESITELLVEKYKR